MINGLGTQIPTSYTNTGGAVGGTGNAFQDQIKDGLQRAQDERVQPRSAESSTAASSNGTDNGSARASLTAEAGSTQSTAPRGDEPRGSYLDIQV